MLKTILKGIYASTLVLGAIGCQTISAKQKEATVSVSMINYSPYQLEDVTIANKIVEMSLDSALRLGKPGEAGTYCCITVPQTEFIQVEFDADLGDGKKHHVMQVPTENVHDVPHADAVLHYLPNKTAVLEFTHQYTAKRKDLLYKSVNVAPESIELEVPYMWKDKSANQIFREKHPD